jgi:hypothetical protein
MPLTESDRVFLATNHGAAMITLGRDGTPKAVRAGVALVDAAFAYLTLETTVTILDGPDAPELSLKLFRTMQDKPTGPLSWFNGQLEEEAFLQTMRDEQRLVYEFDVSRSYGLG